MATQQELDKAVSEATLELLEAIKDRAMEGDGEDAHQMSIALANLRTFAYSGYSALVFKAESAEPGE